MKRPSASGLLGTAVIVSGALLAVWLYVSPYVVIDRVRRAAERGDADTVTSHVDFPAVRQSVKAWMDQPDPKKNPLGALGSMLGPGMTDRLAEALVTPENVRNLIEGRMPRSVRSGGPRRDGDASASADHKPDMRYEAWDRFVVVFRNPRRHEEFTLEWRRSGLTWLLSAVRFTPRPS